MDCGCGRGRRNGATAQRRARLIAFLGEAGARGRSGSIASSRTETSAAGAGLSRTRLKSLIEAGGVSVDGAIGRDANFSVRTGQVIGLEIPPRPTRRPPARIFRSMSCSRTRICLSSTSRPGSSFIRRRDIEAGTLVNALIAHCGESLSGIGGVRRPGIVHRLDKDTSGLLVVAKTDAAHQGLAQTFADHGKTIRLTREYLAFVWGAPARPSGVIDAPLGRHAVDREKIADRPAARGRHAVTHWRVVERFGAEASLIACRLETGRTHQIRVHLAPYRTSAAWRSGLWAGLQEQGGAALVGRPGSLKGFGPAGFACRGARLPASRDRRAAAFRKRSAARHAQLCVRLWREGHRRALPV